MMECHLKRAFVLQLNSALKFGEAERESLKKKIAELTTSLEESKQKVRQLEKVISNQSFPWLISRCFSTTRSV